MGDRTDKIVEFRAVDVEIDGLTILADLDLEVRKGEIIVILGESGCGKTTTLKLVNKLIDPTSGEIIVKGRSTRLWDAVELRRHIGYVLQDGGLFPHMTARQNAAIILTVQGAEPGVAEARADEMLNLVRLEPAKFGDRFPHELSGGQRQRVGVARALASDPHLLLLDEPFGALDALTRADLQKEFAALVRDLGKTALFVTHDLQEALVLATRVVLMHRGRIVFAGTPSEFRSCEIPLARAYLETVLMTA